MFIPPLRARQSAAAPRFFRRSRLAALGFALLLGALAPASHARDLTTLLPPDTLAAASVPSAAGLQRQWSATPLGRFAADPQAAQFLAPGRQRIMDALNQLGCANMTLEQLLGQIDGGACLAALPKNADGSGDEQWVFLAEIRRDSPLIGFFNQGLNARFAGAQRSETAAAAPTGQRYTQIRYVRTEAAKVKVKKKKGKKSRRNDGPDLSLSGIDGVSNAAPVKRQVAEEFDRYEGNGLLILAEGKGHPIERALALLGGGASLGNSSSFKSLCGNSTAAPAVTYFVNLSALTPGFERQIAKQWGKLPLGVIPSELHLEELRAARVSFSADSGAAVLDASLLASTPAPQGVAQFLYLNGSAPSAASAVPASAQVYAARRVELGAAYDALFGLLTRSVTASALYQMQIQSFEQRTGINLRQSLVGALGDQAAVYSAAPDAGHPLKNGVYMLAVRDRAAVERSLGGALNYFGQAFGLFTARKTQLEGTATAWALNGPGQGQAGQTAACVVALTDRWLYLAPSGKTARWALGAGQGEGALAEKAEFRQARQALGAGRSGEFYGSPAALFGLLTSVAPDGKKDGWIDSKNLPPAETFARCFGPAAGERTVDGERLRLRLTLTPAR